jgi:hypothetical protein
MSSVGRANLAPPPCLEPYFLLWFKNCGYALPSVCCICWCLTCQCKSTKNSNPSVAPLPLLIPFLLDPQNCFGGTWSLMGCLRSKLPPPPCHQTRGTSPTSLTTTDDDLVCQAIFGISGQRQPVRPYQDSTLARKQPNWPFLQGKYNERFSVHLNIETVRILQQQQQQQESTSVGSWLMSQLQWLCCSPGRHIASTVVVQLTVEQATKLAEVEAHTATLKDLGHVPEPPRQPTGIYLAGNVGSGKTMLMVSYDCACALRVQAAMR